MLEHLLDLLAGRYVVVVIIQQVGIEDDVFPIEYHHAVTGRRIADRVEHPRRDGVRRRPAFLLVAVIDLEDVSVAVGVLNDHPRAGAAGLRLQDAPRPRGLVRSAGAVFEDRVRELVTPQSVDEPARVRDLVEGVDVLRLGLRAIEPDLGGWPEDAVVHAVPEPAVVLLLGHRAEGVHVVVLPDDLGQWETWFLCPGATDCDHRAQAHEDADLKVHC